MKSSMAALGALLLAASASGAAAQTAWNAEGDAHWQYVADIRSPGQFDELIQEAIDGGKTLFVRTIASDGWGWWVTQSPGWNEITKKFAENPDVMFGDINLSKGGPGNSPKGGDHQAGAGGWPTFKYFNKETGFAGSHYATDDKQTQLPMCDETGPNCAGHEDCKGQSGLMQSYIERKAATSLCSSKPPFKGCAPADKQKMVEVLKKYAKKKVESMEAKLDKLYGAQKSKNYVRFPEEDKVWIRQQIEIIEMVKEAKTEKAAKDQ